MDDVVIDETYSNVVKERIVNALIAQRDSRFIDINRENDAVEIEKDEIERLITQCQTYLKRMKKIPFNTDSVIGMYAREIWIRESNISRGDTMSVVESIISNEKPSVSYHKIIEIFGDGVQVEQKYNEINNIIKCCRELFGKDSIYNSNDFVDISMIFEIHKIIGFGIIDEPGKVRNQNVHVQDHMYPDHSLVPERLSVLVDVTNNSLIKATSFRTRLVIASVFFHEFLSLHPFIDGNGRTGRLLFSHIMRNYTVVPVSLFSPVRTLRDMGDIHVHQYQEYINALRVSEDRKETENYILTYCLRCTKTHLETLWYIFFEPPGNVASEDAFTDDLYSYFYQDPGQ